MFQALRPALKWQQPNIQRIQPPNVTSLSKYWRRVGNGEESYLTRQELNYKQHQESRVIDLTICWCFYKHTTFLLTTTHSSTTPAQTYCAPNRDEHTASNTDVGCNKNFKLSPSGVSLLHRSYHPCGVDDNKKLMTHAVRNPNNFITPDEGDINTTSP